MSPNMMIRSWPFKTILILFAALQLTGCKTDEEKKKEKETTTLRFHMESNAYTPERTSLMAIGRGPLMYVRLDKPWFLSEGDVLKATVIDNVDNTGTWAIAVQFDGHGTIMLDSYTSRYHLMRIGIWARFTEARWLAAPMITRRITNGLFVFTPDCSREEAERIVRGLNHVAHETHKDELKNEPEETSETTDKPADKPK